MSEQPKLRAADTMEPPNKVMLASYALGALLDMKILHSGMILGWEQELRLRT